MTPLLSVRNITKTYGSRIGCAEVSFDLFAGEVMGIGGESGSGMAFSTTIGFERFVASINNTAGLGSVPSEPRSENENNPLPVISDVFDQKVDASRSRVRVTTICGLTGSLKSKVVTVSFPLRKPLNGSFQPPVLPMTTARAPSTATPSECTVPGISKV